jgi:hypothetical protein
MFKQNSVLEVKGNEERIHRYECPAETPLGEAYDALSTMRAHLLEIINQNAQEAPEQEEKPEVVCDACESCDEKVEE